MISSNSNPEKPQKPNQIYFRDNFSSRKKKQFICPCGKPYGSYPALYSHIKRKHQGKAPGQIIKPKSVRRRGRPYKYEPAKLQGQHPHKAASKHLGQYLKRIQIQNQSNQYPLRQFAQQNYKIPAAGFKRDFNDLPRPNFFEKNSRIMHQDFNEKIRTSNNLLDPNYERNFFSNHRSAFEKEELNFYRNQNRNADSLMRNSLPNEGETPKQRRNEWNNGNFTEAERWQNQKKQINQRANEQNSFFGSHIPLYYQQGQYSRAQRKNYHFLRTSQDQFEAIYSKPFESSLKQEMQAKFKPISQGIIDFLEPILNQLLNQQLQKGQSQKPIQISDLQNDKPEILELQRQKPEQVLKQNQKTFSQQHKNYENQNLVLKQPIKVSVLLENEHFRDILKWLMSPPDQYSGHRLKQNYIQSSFRCCLVEFLDFLHHFLETLQHEQVILVLVFFCDHILAETGSLQLQPEPLIYEMGLYFNKFMNEYLPKLLSFMPALEQFYMFQDFKKKVSELLMWMSSWQAVQQYYHNRYHRQRMNYEISQENYKCMMYQRKYQSYIRQAAKQHHFQPESMHHASSQVSQTDGNQEAEEKTEQNAQIIFLNPEDDNSREILQGADENEIVEQSEKSGDEQSRSNVLSQFQIILQPDAEQSGKSQGKKDDIELVQSKKQSMDQNINEDPGQMNSSAQKRV